MKAALLVIDFINGIVRDGSCSAWAQKNPIVANTNKIIKVARVKNIPIYFVRLAFNDDYKDIPKHSKMFNYVKQNKMFRLGQADTDFVSELDYQSNVDMVINKTGASPFAGNDLESQLEAQSIEQLIFTGVATDNAISAGVRYAHDQGFATIIVEDTCGAASADLHYPILKALEKIANQSVAADELINQLAG